jgi:uncharacterized protein (DUF2062 family)
MIHLTRGLIRKWLDTLLHIRDTPERTAAAFALGVFFGFSPFLGLHTLLGIVFAFMFNLNRVAVLLGVYSNLPWFLGPYYVVTTMMGARLMGDPMPRGFGMRLAALFELSLFGPEFWEQLGVVLRPLAWPYLIGSTIGALVLAAVSYYLALAFIASRRRLHNALHHHHHGKP